jgi:hypothetical protein
MNRQIVKFTLWTIAVLTIVYLFVTPLWRLLTGADPQGPGWVYLLPFAVMAPYFVPALLMVFMLVYLVLQVANAHDPE